MNTQKYGLFCSLENLLFFRTVRRQLFTHTLLHHSSTTPYSLFTFLIHSARQFACEQALLLVDSREVTRKETWVRGWRARSQATRQWDTSSLLGQFSFVLLNPIVFNYLRNHLTSLVLSFPLTSSFFYIIFFGTDCHIYVSSSSKTSFESQREDHSTRIQVWLIVLRTLLCANWI